MTRYNERLRIARELDVGAAQKLLINEFPQYRHSRFFTLVLLHKFRCHRSYKREISKGMVRLPKKWLKDHKFSEKIDIDTLTKEGFVDATEHVESGESLWTTKSL